MKDDLGDRIKEYYESRTKTFLPRRTNTVLRLDGKAFHTYTRGLNKPFDDGLIEDMNKAAIYLCENIQGAKLAYVQSDEISILLTDYDKLGTDAWFDGNVQKITSVSASYATKGFFLARLERFLKDTGVELLNPSKYGEFDSRVFTIPLPIEVTNYFIWRQKDAIRNSISMCAQSMFSHKELNGKKTNDMQEMMFQKGFNWNDLADHKKRGSIVSKHRVDIGNAVRTKWLVSAAPEFTKDRELILNLFPKSE